MDVRSIDLSRTHAPESDSARASAGAHVAFAVPLSDLGVGPTITFNVVVERDGIVIERHPESQPIRLDLPGPDFAARHWRA